MPDKLKPCPFCGGSAWSRNAFAVEMELNRVESFSPPDKHIVGCSHCHGASVTAQGEGDPERARQYAESLWNRRYGVGDMENTGGTPFPGNWRIMDYGGRVNVISDATPGGERVALVGHGYACRVDSDELRIQHLATARLIAAAPDLLEACRAAITIMKKAGLDRVLEYVGGEGPVHHYGFRDKTEMLKAAIAKTTGEPHE